MGRRGTGRPDPLGSRGRRRRGRAPLWLVALACIFAALARYLDPPDPTRVIIDSALDGDSLVYQRAGERREVRLFGVDCPEKGQAFGEQARAFTQKRVAGKSVRLIIHDTDRYGREVAEVILPDGASLNLALVQAGYAWWYDHHAGDEHQLAHLEEQARKARRGLWVDAHPIPPWEFRREQRRQAAKP